MGRPHSQLIGSVGNMQAIKSYLFISLYTLSDIQASVAA